MFKEELEKHLTQLKKSRENVRLANEELEAYSKAFFSWFQQKAGEKLEGPMPLPDLMMKAVEIYESENKSASN